jgi:hypothetical protein
MRELGPLALAIVLSTSGAIAGTDGTDAPISYHIPGETIVTHHPIKPIPLKDYPKITWLGKEISLQCLAAQCLATAESFADVPDGAGAQELCTYIDGKPMKPFCQTVDLRNLQSERVTTGTHTFRTGIVNGFVSGGTVCPCEIIYHLYDSGN